MEKSVELIGAKLRSLSGPERLTPMRGSSRELQPPVQHVLFESSPRPRFLSTQPHYSFGGVRLAKNYN